MTEWQLIETAPRDGAFLAFCDAEIIEDRYVVAMWDRNDGEFYRPFDDEFICPTHWMPLPEPPE